MKPRFLFLFICLILISFARDISPVQAASTQWYFRNTNASTGPTAKASTDTDSFPTVPSGKNTPKDMGVTKGSAQTSVAGAYIAANLYTMVRIFVGPALGAQTLTGGQAGYKVGVGTQESSVSMNKYQRTFVYVWRSGSGNVKTIIVPTSCGTEHTTAERGCVITATGAAGDFSILQGDRIVVEIWWDLRDATTSYTATLYWDGTTDVVEASTTSDAAGFFYCPQTLLYPSYQYSTSQRLYLYESQTKLAGYQRSASQKLSLFESLARQISVSFSASQLLNLYGAIGKQAGFSFSLSQKLNLYEYAEKISAQSYEYAVSQFLNLYSLLSRQVSLSISKVDFLGLLSSASRQTSVSSAKSDMLNLLGFPARQISVFSSPLDQLGLYTSIEKLAGFPRSQADILSLFAEITRQISVSYNPADLLGLYSTAIREVGISSIRSEALNLFDSAARQVSVSKSALDKLILYSGLERLVGFYRTQNQLLDLYSSVSREAGIVKAVTDTLSLSSSLLKQISISKSASDVLALVGSIARQIAVQRPLGDFLQLLSDAQKGGIQQYYFSLGDLLRLFGKTTGETTNAPTVPPGGWLPLVKFTVGALNLNVVRNQTVNTLLNFTWQGAGLITVTNVRFEGPTASWFSLAETLPKTVSNETGVGKSAVKIRVTVPNNAQLGERIVPVTIDARAMRLTEGVPELTEVIITDNGLVFVVVTQPLEYPLILVLVLFIAVVIGLALALHPPKTRHTRR